MLTTLEHSKAPEGPALRQTYMKQVTGPLHVS